MIDSGALPAGWSLVPLGELLTAIDSGKSFKCEERPPEAHEVGVIKVSAVSWGEYQESESKTCVDAERIEPDYFVRPGDFLFSRANTIELVGACVIAGRVSKRLMLSDKILRLHFAMEDLKPWVLQYLRSKAGRDQIELLASGNQESMRNIGQERLRQILVPLPPSNERESIGFKLDELLSQLAAASGEVSAATRKLIRYRQSLLKSAVEGTLTAAWRRGKATSAWTSATIGELADVGTGVTPLRSNARFFEGGSIAWVTSGALNAPVVTAASEFVTEAALAECRLTTYPPGTLLVAMYGEGKTRGKCAELGIAATINQAVAAIVLRTAFEHRRPFLKIFLWHSYETMRQMASGGVQPNLNLQIIKNIRVPLPPVDEQHEIVRLLDELLEATKAQEDALSRSLAMASAQRQNILRAAFSGQLVPQDPSDEPASALVDRIRAQRQTAAPTAKRKAGRPAKVAA